MRKYLSLLALFLAILLMRTAVAQENGAESEAAEPKIVESIVLLGDGGKIAREMRPLLRAHLENQTAPVSVVFLGDNIYSHGIPRASDQYYSRSLTRIQKLIDAVKGTASRAFFVPGNHDWDFQGPDGWQAVLRQQEIVEKQLGPRSFQPRNACPGPAEIIKNSHFHVVAVDTQWFIHEYSKPIAECENKSLAEVLASLVKIFESTPATAARIFVSHHPLESYGEHGLEAGCPQNSRCPAYVSMSKALTTVFERFRPAVCAAGHDHNLQVVQNQPGCKTFLVSGAASELTDVGKGEGLAFARSSNGLMRLDATADGKLLLRVFVVDKYFKPPNPGGVVAYSAWLEK